MYKVFAGYDIRIAGEVLKKYANKDNYSMRPELLSTSFDIDVCESIFARDDSDKEEFQISLDDNLFSNYYFRAIGFFESDREALSFLGKPAYKDKARLYMYRLIFVSPPKSEPIAGYADAISLHFIKKPTLEFELVGYELLDNTLTSATHLYYDISAIEGIEIIPENLKEIQQKMGDDDLFLVEIQEAQDNWWFR